MPVLLTQNSFSKIYFINLIAKIENKRKDVINNWHELKSVQNV